MLTLYAAKGTVALAPHIALQETGLPYQVSWLKGDGVNIAEYPKLAAHFAAVGARPACAHVIDLHG